MPRKSACASIMSGTLRLDIYRRPFHFLMPDHEPEYRTLTGFFFSLLTILLLLSYAAYKFLDLVQLNDYRLQESV